MTDTLQWSPRGRGGQGLRTIQGSQHNSCLNKSAGCGHRRRSRRVQATLGERHGETTMPRWLPCELLPAGNVLFVFEIISTTHNFKYLQAFYVRVVQDFTEKWQIVREFPCSPHSISPIFNILNQSSTCVRIDNLMQIHDYKPKSILYSDFPSAPSRHHAGSTSHVSLAVKSFFHPCVSHR